jgi:hypothetical protein
MSAVDEEAELTREDKARLKALLKLLDKAVRGGVDTPRPGVQDSTDPGRRAKIRAKVIKHLKRQGRL